MALIDDVERYGQAIDAGTMTREAAADALVTAAGGGLTLEGARRMLDDWPNQRNAYLQEGKRAAAAMDEIYGLDDIQP